MQLTRGSRLALIWKHCKLIGETHASPCAVSSVRVLPGLFGRSFMHGRTEVRTRLSRIISSLLPTEPAHQLATTSSLFQRGFACGKGTDEGEGGAPASAENEDSKERDSALQMAADSGSMSELLGVVEHSGEHFSEQNVVTSFANLAKLGGGKNDGQLESLYGEAPFLTLVDMVIRGTGRFNEKQLLSILGDCVKLGYDDEMLVDNVTAQLLQQMASLSAAQLLDLASSLAEAQNSPSIILFDAIQARAEDLGDDLTDGMKKDLHDAYATLGYQHLSGGVKSI